MNKTWLIAAISFAAGLALMHFYPSLLDSLTGSKTTVLTTPTAPKTVSQAAGPGTTGYQTVPTGTTISTPPVRTLPPVGIPRHIGPERFRYGEYE